MLRNSKVFWIRGAIGVGATTFLMTELLHWFLDPDPERIATRLRADALSGAAVALLGMLLAHYLWERRQAANRRLEMIAELNHHIRNALEVISLSAYMTKNQDAIQSISKAVERIDDTLRGVSVTHDTWPRYTPEQPVRETLRPVRQ